jgi:hypothetical protein
MNQGLHTVKLYATKPHHPQYSVNKTSFITPHHTLHYVEAVSLLDDDFTAEAENVMRGQLY